MYDPWTRTKEGGMLEGRGCRAEGDEGKKKLGQLENQDGSIGRHTAPPRTTRTDRKSNSKEVV